MRLSAEMFRAICLLTIVVAVIAVSTFSLQEKQMVFGIKRKDNTNKKLNKESK